MKTKHNGAPVNCPVIEKTCSPKKILIIDDEHMVCETLQDILQEDGYQVRIALNALSGLAEIERETPDLIISDLKLPDLSGLELLKRVKHKRPNLEIIIMTGLGEAETYLEAKEEGAFDYIIKPINIPILRLMISKVLYQN
jgi:DNA-binding NtrC family response regulator